MASGALGQALRHNRPRAKGSLLGLLRQVESYSGQCLGSIPCFSNPGCVAMSRSYNIFVFRFPLLLKGQRGGVSLYGVRPAVHSGHSVHALRTLLLLHGLMKVFGGGI